MLKRTITAIVAIAIFIPVCWFSDTAVWPIAMTILSVVAAYEMTKCVGASKHVSLLIPAFLTALFVPCLVWRFPFPHNTWSGVLGIYAAFLLWTFTADVFSHGKIDYAVSAASFMGIFYTSLAFACLVWLRDMTGPYRYLLVFIGPWVSDTFAYLTGRAIGKHKLIPEVSPKKTVEGAVGGVVFAALAFVLYGWILRRFFTPDAGTNLIVMAGAGALVAVISQIGDLAMSVIKRRYGVKDYGRIFPGHGGVLDRFDSVLLTAPVLVILSQIPAVSALLV
ncbi:MAG: phosphatidate cytidylyltransferase [Clostridia bacterium]|nr:phosphatidate cytidylyltransferase [Clostridia bacterium]